jgi:hypothetical protein
MHTDLHQVHRTDAKPVVPEHSELAHSTTTISCAQSASFVVILSCPDSLGFLPEEIPD